MKVTDEMVQAGIRAYGASVFFDESKETKVRRILETALAVGTQGVDMSLVDTSDGLRRAGTGADRQVDEQAAHMAETHFQTGPAPSQFDELLNRVQALEADHVRGDEIVRLIALVQRVAEALGHIADATADLKLVLHLNSQRISRLERAKEVW